MSSKVVCIKMDKVNTASRILNLATLVAEDKINWNANHHWELEGIPSFNTCDIFCTTRDSKTFERCFAGFLVKIS